MTEILVATDLHGSLARAKDLVQAIEREKPALFVFLGDLNYNGARNPLTDGYSPREVTALIKELSGRNGYRQAVPGILFRGERR